MFWHTFLNVSARSMVAVFALFALAKLIGARQLAQLTFYDYVCGITIGSLAAVAGLDDQIPLWTCILSMFIIAGVCYGAEILTQKSIVLRRVLTGTPKVVIDNGQLIEKNLRIARYDVNDLLRECRSSGYFDISQIEIAMLEANGKLSILPKSADRPPTAKDMGMEIAQDSLLANVVIDGNIMEDNLRRMNKTVEWLRAQLQAQNQKLKDVLLATLDNQDRVICYSRHQTTKHERVLT